MIPLLKKRNSFRHPPRTARRGFTLLELLVVIAIMAIMLVLVLPGVGSILQANDLSSAGKLVSDQFALARQEAMARNRQVEIRFIQTTNSDFRALQLWMQKPGANNFVPLQRVAFLSPRVAISTFLSPLLSDPNATMAGTTNFGGSLGNAAYRALAFRANGAPNASLSASNNFLTIVGERDATNPSPSNYSAIQIIPENGRVHSFRP